MGTIIALVLVAALLIYSSFSWGFVVFKFWYWFLLPVFPALPHVSFYEAVGLMLFIGLFHNQNPKQVKKAFRDEKLQWITVFLGPWIVLICAWFIKLFI